MRRTNASFSGSGGLEPNAAERGAGGPTGVPASFAESPGATRRTATLVIAPSVAVLYVAAALIGDSSADTAVIAWICFSGLLLTVPLVLERRLDPFSPAFFFVFLRMQWIGKPCLEVLFGGYANSQLEHLTAAESSELLRGALGILVLGMCGYWLGYYSSAFRVIPPVRLGLPRRFQRGRLKIAIAASAMVIVLVYGLFLRMAGGFASMLNSMGERSEVYAGANFVAWVLDLAAVPLLFAALLRKLRSRRHPRWLVFLTVPVVLLLAATGDRSRALVPALMVVVFWHYSIRRVKPVLLVGIALVLIFLAVGIRELRQSSFGGRETDFTTLESAASGPLVLVERFLLGRRTVDLIGVLLYITPERLPFQYGATYVRALAMPIPRAIWPEKPHVDESGLIGRALYGDDYYGLPVGTEGVLYLNFHLPGVLFGMFFLGAVHRRIYERLRQSSDSPAVVILYAVALYFLFAFTGIGLFNLAMAVGPVWLLLRFAGARHASVREALAEA